MKTVIYKEIDGYNIVTGTDMLLIDGVATRRKAKQEIEDSDIYKELVALSSEYLKKADKKAHQGQIFEIRTNLEQKKIELAKQTEEAMKANLTYLEPREGEHQVSTEEALEYEELIRIAAANKELVTLEKERISNNKGKEYLVDNNGVLEKKVIDKIGSDFPENAITEPTQEQLDQFANDEEVRRLDSLTQEQKQAEFNTKKSGIINQTMMKITELEMSGVSNEDAKTQAYAQFNPQIEDLKIKYNITE